MGYLRRDGEDLLISVYVQPRASRDEIAGPYGDALRIRVAAPPVDGAANEALCRFIAGLCGVAKRAVSVDSGDTGRRKTVRVHRPVRVPEAFGAEPNGAC